MTRLIRWEPTCTEANLGQLAFGLVLEAMDLSADGFAAYEAQLTSAGATFGVLQDTRRDVVGVVDAGGSLVEVYDYDLYGTRRTRDPLNSLCSFAKRSGLLALAECSWNAASIDASASTTVRPWIQ